MNTDKTWRWYGDNDPYYGVLTDDAFRGGNLTSEHKAAFFESGQKHITQLLSELEAAQFSVGRIKALDFGCRVVCTRTTRGGVFIWAQRGNQPAIF